MFNKETVRKNIIKSYSENIGFIVYTAEELQKMYQAIGVDPKSTDRRVFDTESMSHHLQSEVMKLIKMMNITKNDLILDVGCGNGAPSRLIAKMCSCKLIAFDINPNQIIKATDCDRLECVNHLIQREVKDVHDLNYPEKFFDKIFHNETMCHWMNQKTALAGLFKILKKNGIMGFHDWLKGDKSDLTNAGGNFPGTYAESVWYQNSLEETIKLLEETGFKVLYSEDTTDVVDRGLRARLREIQMSKVYLKAASKDYFHKTKQYFKVLIETHYDYLRYGRFLCIKN